MQLGKKEKQRGYLEISLELSLSCQCAALGVILSCAFTFFFLVGENTKYLLSSWYMGNNLWVYKNEML